MLIINVYLLEFCLTKEEEEEGNLTFSLRLLIKWNIRRNNVDVFLETALENHFRHVTESFATEHRIEFHVDFSNTLNAPQWIALGVGRATSTGGTATTACPFWCAGYNWARDGFNRLNGSLTGRDHCPGFTYQCTLR